MYMCSKNTTRIQQPSTSASIPAPLSPNITSVPQTYPLETSLGNNAEAFKGQRASQFIFSTFHKQSPTDDASDQLLLTIIDFSTIPRLVRISFRAVYD